MYDFIVKNLSLYGTDVCCQSNDWKPPQLNDSLINPYHVRWWSLDADDDERILMHWWCLIPGLRIHITNYIFIAIFIVNTIIVYALYNLLCIACHFTSLYCIPFIICIVIHCMSMHYLLWYIIYACHCSSLYVTRRKLHVNQTCQHSRFWWNSPVSRHLGRDSWIPAFSDDSYCW